MNSGKIARVMSKGYGFVSQEGQDKDLFFHINELKLNDGEDKDQAFDSLKEGMDVQFDIEDGPKGPSAINVQRV